MARLTRIKRQILDEQIRRETEAITVGWSGSLRLADAYHLLPQETLSRCLWAVHVETAAKLRTPPSADLAWEPALLDQLLWEAVQAAIRAKWLVATGMDTRIGKRVSIDPELLLALDVDRKKSEARGAGVDILSIEVSQAGQSEPVRDTSTKKLKGRPPHERETAEKKMLEEIEQKRLTPETLEAMQQKELERFGAKRNTAVKARKNVLSTSVKKSIPDNTDKFGSSLFGVG